MEPSELLKAGRLDEALKALQARVRQSPQDVPARVLLFGLECVLGRWDKALTHLDTIVSLNPEWTTSAEMYRRLVGCEARRAEVFAGKQKPIVLGEPPSWVAWCIQALASDAAGDSVEAWDLRARALDESPACRATVAGKELPWLSDGDLRFGPILEAYLDGEYYWIPFSQIEQWETKPPKTLVELVWLAATIRLVTGGEVHAFLPVRYPDTQAETDAALRLGRRTEWRKAGGGNIGLGQKLFESDGADFLILECRSVQFTQNSAAQ